MPRRNKHSARNGSLPARGPPAVSGAPAPSKRAWPGRARRRWWLLAAAATVLGGFLGVVIATAARPSQPDLASAPPLPGGYFSREHGQQAPSWQLPDLSRPSQTISPAQFRGRPLVINFWASWCPPCRQEMPVLERAARQLRGRVSFAGLDTQDEQGAALAFARQTGVTYPLAIDNAQVYASYGVAGLPVTFFVTADGAVVGRQIGGMTQSGLDTLVREVFGIAVNSG
jgi:cytochrome c biogenesis protein CcmG, thiol:disulfide interchange protein DsbE